MSAPFFSDDETIVLENRSIRHLRAFGDLLAPSVLANGWMGRPVVNLSIALNYAFGGASPRGYHAMNVALHLLNALLLFGVVRRTLLVPRWRGSFAAIADVLAGAIALTWAVHPLQTQSVVCVAQRADLLVGMFCWLTLYCYLRATAGPFPWQWNAAAIGACALGMASSEVMAAVPLIVLLHDAVFVAGSWREAWRQRRSVYAGLAATWLVLAWLIAQSGGGGASAGLGGDVTWWACALTQCAALVRYLWLAVWPHPLVFDYGPDMITNPADVRWQIVVLVTLAVATVMALRRRAASGFLGACFFVLLASSSSVLPLANQAMAEHRMYLPLAAVITLLVMGGYRMTQNRGLAIWLALPTVFIAATRARVTDYSSELRIWSDTALKRPMNARAHLKLGDALQAAGALPDAITQYEVAFQLQPARPDTLSSLAGALLAAGRVDEAIGCAIEAVRAAPNFAEAHHILGDCLARAGRLESAVAEYRAALKLKPTAGTHLHLADALARLERNREAIAEAEAALRIDPALAGAKELLERLRR